MTDIYVGQQPSPARRVIVLLVVAVAVAAAAYFIFFRKGPGSQPKAETPATAPNAEAPAAPQTAPAATSASQAPGSAPNKGTSLLAQARQLQTEDKLQEAREKAYEVLAAPGNDADRKAAEEILGQVNISLVLSPRQMPEKTDYTVQPGDSLAGLAKTFGTTIETIRKGNRLNSATIRAFDRLRIFSGTFTINVDKSDNVLTMYLNDKFFKRYGVGTGEYGKTPTGEFHTVESIAQPTWWRSDGKAVPYGDTNNVLGTHWISLDIPGYGIHGTWRPETIGKQASAGCIRLLNENIEELYTIVPSGTKVIITN